MSSIPPLYVLDLGNPATHTLTTSLERNRVQFHLVSITQIWSVPPENVMIAIDTSADLPDPVRLFLHEYCHHITPVLDTRLIVAGKDVEYRDDNIAFVYGLRQDREYIGPIRALIATSHPQDNQADTNDNPDPLWPPAPLSRRPARMSILDHNREDQP